MATDRDKFDDGDEAQLAWLLTSAHDGPGLDGEFVAKLSRRLDADFAALRAEVAPARSGYAAHAASYTGSTNGEGPRAPRRSPVYHDVDPVTSALVRPGHAKPWRRWVVWAATAAALLAAAAVLSDPPAWAAVFRAIVQEISEWSGVGGRRAAAVADSEEQAAVPVRPPALAPGAPAERAAAAPDVVLEAAPPVDAFAMSRPPADAKRIESSPAANAAPEWQPRVEPQLSKTIDEQLAAVWIAQGIRPVERSSDAEFMRRVYLDLTGRIPTVSEVHEFLDDASPDRRERLVDRLLAHHDHATHLAAVWRQVLIPEDVDLTRYGGAAKFEEWLSERFAANLPYDQIVRDLLRAEGRVAESGPLLFYAALRLNPEELAGRTSRAFLGVRMECAQCHDHPFDEKLSQHDFWGFAAFFARISRPRGKMEMTSPVLAVRDNQRGDVTIPDSEEVVPPRLPQLGAALQDTADGPSRREELAAWLTSPQNRQFARATVNRVWSQLFGRGLVEPVDDMRPANPPIAPKLLDTLSRDFAGSRFDLQRLFRALVLTNAYQLSSRSEVDDPSRTMCFAQMNVKSFTAEQLYDCILVATQRAAMTSGPRGEAGLLRFSDIDRQTFLQQFRAPPGQVTDYHAGIPQALTLMHGGLIHGATDLATSGILKSLSAPFFTDEQRLDALFLSTLSRYPEQAERDAMAAIIAAANTDEEKQQALGDVLWALLNSAEFTFNH